MDRGRLNKKIFFFVGTVAEAFRRARYGLASQAEAATSRPTEKLRQTTAQMGPTAPTRQNRGERTAVKMIRRIVARLALPVALPLYGHLERNSDEKQKLKRDSGQQRHRRRIFDGGRQSDQPPEKQVTCLGNAQ